MLLIPFVVFTAMGFGTWLLGHFYGYHGIAAIGAVLVIALGGAVALTDLRVRTGETVVNQYETQGNELVLNESTTSYEFETVAISEELSGVGSFSVGGLTMIVGGLLLTRHLEELL